MYVLISIDGNHIQFVNTKLYSIVVYPIVLYYILLFIVIVCISMCRSINFHNSPSVKRMRSNILLIFSFLNNANRRITVHRKHHIFNLHILKIEQQIPFGRLQLQSLNISNSHLMRNNKILNNHQQVLTATRCQTLEISNKFKSTYLYQCFY